MMTMHMHSLGQMQAASAESTHSSMLQPVLGAALSAGQVNAAAALVYQAKAAHAVSQQCEYGDGGARCGSVVSLLGGVPTAHLTDVLLLFYSAPSIDASDAGTNGISARRSGWPRTTASPLRPRFRAAHRAI